MANGFGNLGLTQAILQATPKSGAERFGQNIGGLGQVLAQQALQKKQQEQALAQAIALEEAKAKIKQANQSPLEQFLTLGKIGQAAQTLGLDMSQILGGQVPGRQTGIPGQARSIQATPTQTRDTIDVTPISATSEPARQASPVLGFNRPPQQDSDLIIKEFEKTALGGFQPKKAISKVGIQTEETIKGAAKASAKQTEEFITSTKNLNRVINLFSTLTSQLKGKAEEQGGLGILPSIRGQFGAFRTSLTGKKPGEPGFGRTKAFEGQLEEVAIGMSPILTGQNRIIKGIVAMIKNTLPTGNEEESIAAQKIAQSLTNAFKLTIAFKRNLLSPDEVQALNTKEDNVVQEQIQGLANGIALNSQEQAVLQQIIQDVLSAEPSKPLSLFKSGNAKQQPSRKISTSNIKSVREIK